VKWRLAALCWLFWLPAAAAAEEQIVSGRVHQELSAAHAALERGDAAEAAQILEEISDTEGLTPLERASILQSLGYAYHAQERPAAAAEALLAALALEALPAATGRKLRYQAGRLLLQAGRHREGIAELERWLPAEPAPKAEDYLVLALAWYRLEGYRELIPYIRKALARNAEPPRAWRELLLAAYLETQDYRNAAQALETLLAAHPGETALWLQLAALYQSLQREHEALASYELAYGLGPLATEDLERLAQLYLRLNLPYRAASLLRRELGARLPETRPRLELLWNAWLAAREPGRAAAVMERAARQDAEAALYRMLGQTYIGMGRWRDARAALEQALRLGVDAAAEGETLYSLGLAACNEGAVEDALAALRRASAHSSARNAARAWLGYLEREPRRCRTAPANELPAAAPDLPH